MENISYVDKIDEYKKKLNEVEEQLNKLKIESQVTENEIRRLLTELKESGVDVSGLEELEIVKINLSDEIKKLEDELSELKS